MDAKFAALSADMRKALRKAGFASVRAVLDMKPSQLAKELELDISSTMRLLEELREQSHSVVPKILNVFELIQTQEKSGVRHLTTCCRPLDLILDGGFARGTVTELCGAPGAGKTQLCIQAAVSVTIPEACIGFAGDALYLDTEGSFSPQRALEMAEALSSNLASKTEGDVVVPTTDEILSRIHVCRAYDAGEQLAFVQNLKRYLAQYPNVRLVIVDSVAHHFRHEFPDAAQRGKILARMANELNAAASEFDIVVLVTNHMTTRTDHSLVPALGEHWFHGVANRIVLTRTEEIIEWRHPKRKQESSQSVAVPVRRAEIVKASALKLASSEFVVVSIGIRSVPTRAAGGEAKRPKMQM